MTARKKLLTGRRNLFPLLNSFFAVFCQLSKVGIDCLGGLSLLGAGICNMLVQFSDGCNLLANGCQRMGNFIGMFGCTGRLLASLQQASLTSTALACRLSMIASISLVLAWVRVATYEPRQRQRQIHAPVPQRGRLQLRH